MKTQLLLLLFVASAPPASDKSAPSDTELIQGRWQVESVITDGVERPNAVGKHYHIRGHVWSFEGRKRKGTEQFIFLDPKSDPRRVFIVSVFSFDDGSTSAVTLMGIYSVNNDTLKLCVFSGTARMPTKFESTKNSEYDLFVMKRAK
jgi:uncharacterized protein (TIGR03067 family)